MDESQTKSIQRIDKNILLTIKSLEKQVEDANVTIKELRDANNICIAWGTCKNKSSNDSRFCITHRCKYKKCIESKQYNVFGQLMDQYCSIHDRLWKRF